MSNYLPDTCTVPEAVSHSLGSITELNIPKSLLDRAYRYPCKEIDRNGNVIRIISSDEQLEVYRAWVSKYISYGWTKTGLSRGAGG